MCVRRVDDLVAAKLVLASSRAVDELEPVAVTVGLYRGDSVVATNLDVRTSVERTAQHLEKRLKLDGILHRAHRIDDVVRIGELRVLLPRQRAGELARRREPLRAPTDAAVLVVDRGQVIAVVLVT